MNPENEQNVLGEVHNEFQSTSMVNILVKEVEDLKTLNHALWELLKLRDFTDDEFNAALAGVMQLRKHKNYEIQKEVACPGCGKSLQYSKGFEIKCIYCGTTMVMNPYQKYNAIIERGFDPSSNETYEEQVPQQVAPAAQEYNIEDDLRFDEL